MPLPALPGGPSAPTHPHQLQVSAPTPTPHTPTSHTPPAAGLSPQPPPTPHTPHQLQVSAPTPLPGSKGKTWVWVWCGWRWGGEGGC